jgi:hypothetical protein
MNSRSSSIFEVSSSVLIGDGTDLLGIWTPVAAPQISGISFDTASETASAIPPDVPVWRATLPRNVRQAETALVNAEARLKKSESVLDDVPGRVRAMLGTRSGGVSFESAAAPGLSTAEREFLAALQVVRAGQEPTSFGLGDWVFKGWEKWVGSADKFQQFLNQMMTALLHAAWVETQVEAWDITRVGDRCFARSGVGWGGDTRTVWRPGTLPERIALHQKNVELALMSRQDVIRLLLLALDIAAQVAALVNMPGNMMKLIPAVWRLVTQLLDEVDT